MFKCVPRVRTVYISPPSLPPPSPPLYLPALRQGLAWLIFLVPSASPRLRILLPSTRDLSWKKKGICCQPPIPTNAFSMGKALTASPSWDETRPLHLLIAMCACLRHVRRHSRSCRLDPIRQTAVSYRSHAESGSAGGAPTSKCYSISACSISISCAPMLVLCPPSLVAFNEAWNPRIPNACCSECLSPAGP